MVSNITCRTYATILKDIKGAASMKSALVDRA